MGSVWDGVLKSRRLAPSPKNEIHVASFAPLRETLPRSSSRHAATARRHRGTGSMNPRPEGAKPVATLSPIGRRPKSPFHSFRIPHTKARRHEGTKARRHEEAGWDPLGTGPQIPAHHVTSENEIFVASFAPLRETLARSSSRHAATARRHRAIGSMNPRPEGAKPVATLSPIGRRPDVAVPQLPDSSHEGTKARRHEGTKKRDGIRWGRALKSRRITSPLKMRSSLRALRRCVRPFRGVPHATPQRRDDIEGQAP
jgi:hypothetical protein